MNPINVFEGLHWWQRAFCVFLELLIIGAVSVDFGFPLEGRVVFDFFVFEVHEKRPDEFSVDEVVKAPMSSSGQKFQQIAILLWSLRGKWRITFLKRISSESYFSVIGLVRVSWFKVCLLINLNFVYKLMILTFLLILTIIVEFWKRIRS